MHVAFFANLGPEHMKSQWNVLLSVYRDAMKFDSRTVSGVSLDFFACLEAKDKMTLSMVLGAEWSAPKWFTRDVYELMKRVSGRGCPDLRASGWRACTRVCVRACERAGSASHSAVAGPLGACSP